MAAEPPLESEQLILNSVHGNQISAAYNAGDGFLRVSTIAGGGSSSSYVSATIDNGSVSAKSGDASQFRTSAVQGDAGLLHVSAVGATFSLSADASGNRVSAIQIDANNLHVSSVQGDAGLFRVSAIGGTTGDHTLVDGTTQTISATLTPISASPATSVAGLVVNAFQFDSGKHLVSAKQGDAGLLHVSAFVDSGSVSAVQGAATNLRVSGFSNDGGLFRVSAIGGDANTLHVSSVQGDAGLFHVSVVGTLTVSAHEVKQSDASALLTSAKSGDGNQFHVSAVQGDGGLLRVSSIGGDAGNDRTSAIQGDSGLLHVSASIFPDTTGGLTTFSNFNVSTSQTIKSTAGSVYGWYAWNMDTKPVYVNLYNTSGAINVGTDAIKIQIALPASAAANVFTPIGIAGFTAGIGVAAVSGAVSTSNSPPAASAVGINVFYK